jgi:hypothetical protein
MCIEKRRGGEIGNRESRRCQEFPTEFPSGSRSDLTDESKVGTKYSGESISKAMFSQLIIHTFQLVFFQPEQYFSFKKTTGTMFQLVFQHQRTGPNSFALL